MINLLKWDGNEQNKEKESSIYKIDCYDLRCNSFIEFPNRDVLYPVMCNLQLIQFNFLGIIQVPLTFVFNRF